MLFFKSIFPNFVYFKERLSSSVYRILDIIDWDVVVILSD